jgi:RNA polymerase sigma factor (sigma-70 family)
LRRFSRRDRLINTHLHLVPPIARKIHGKLPASFDLLDLVSSGTLGLIHAAQRCNLSRARNKEAMFAGYARQRIRGAILDSVRRGRFLEATHQPIETAAGKSVEPTAPCTLDCAQRAKAISSAFRALPAREARLLYSHYWGGAPIAQIALEMGLSVSRAYELHLRALAAMRKSLPIRLLERAA